MQNDVFGGVLPMEHEGGAIVTMRMHVLVQPIPGAVMRVTVAVYVVLTAGVTVMHDVVAPPGLQA